MYDLVIHGLKGIEAHQRRAYSLGKKDEDAEKILVNIQQNKEKDLVQLIMEIGKLNLRYTQLLNMNIETEEKIIKVTNTIIKGLKEEKIKGFYIIGGNEKEDNEHFHNLANTATDDIIILTFGEVLNKYNHIPRLIHLGDLSRVYDLVKVLLALIDSFHCDINELPMKIFMYWEKPEALCSVMTLLSLGIKNMHIEPKLSGILKT